MRRALVALMLAALAAGCGGARSARVETELTVFAAASLGMALDQAAGAFEVERPGTRIVLSFDSSAALATQIEQGAPADIFLAADEANPRRLIESGLVDGPAVPFATNGLAIVVPADNPGGIRSPADLARPGLTVIAAGADVPITAYAGRLIEGLSREPGYPADFATSYAANIVSREDNVRAVLAKIALGEGDAAIVYTTDARASSDVASLPIPEHVAESVLARYDGVVLARSGDRAAARAFLDWLAEGEGQATLAAAGFGPP